MNTAYPRACAPDFSGVCFVEYEEVVSQFDDIVNVESQLTLPVLPPTYTDMNPQEPLPGMDSDKVHHELLLQLVRGGDPDALAKILVQVETLPVELNGRDLLISSARMATELGATIRQHQQRERGLLAVSETAAALTQLRSPSHVLDGIVRRGRQLLGSHIAWLAGFDRAAGTTFVIAIDGVNTEPIRVMRVPLSTGIAGRVAESGLPFWTGTYKTDERIHHSFEVDNTISGEGLISAAGVPLFMDEAVVGVLIVGDRYSRSYLPWEIATLATLASHAAIAMRNAQAFEDTRAALKSAEDANLQLQKQTRDIELAAEAHENLTRLVVKGGGVPELASMVATMLGGRIEVLDESGVVVSVGSNKERPSDPEQTSRLGALSESRVLEAMTESRVRGPSVDVPGHSGGSCRVATAFGVAGLLGAVVVYTDHVLSPNQILIHERSALVLALILLSNERRSASKRDEISYVVGGLLNPYVNVGQDLHERAHSLGLDLTGSILLLALEVEGVRTGLATRKISEAMAAKSALVTELDGRIVVLLHGDDAVQLRNQLAAITEKIPGVTYFGVVARRDMGKDALSSAYESLKRSLALLRSLGRRSALVIESELIPYTLIFDKQRVEDMDGFLQTTIGPLLKQDSRKGSHLAETLLAYLDHGYGAKATASHLGIHVNTLMNRLEAVDALLGDWQRQKRGAEVHIALRLWRLQSAGRQSP